MLKHNRPSVRWVWASLALVTLLVFILQLRWSPPNHKVHVDGTVFAYGGQRVLAGDLPYRDFWDHKPPGVYYLNAFAFRLFGGPDAWSIWYLTTAYSVVIGVACLSLLRQFLPLAWALVGTCALSALILMPEFYEGPNITEIYGVLPTLLGFTFTYKWFSTRKPVHLLGLGAALAVSILIKHTGVASSAACLATVLAFEAGRGNLRDAGRALITILLPVVASVMVVFTYWGIHGALADFWEATVTYNLLYVDNAWTPRLFYGAIRSIAQKAAILPVLALAASVGALHIGYLAQRARRGSPILRWAATEWAFVAFLVALVFEVLALSILAYRYDHYYVATIPAICVTAFYWFREESPAWLKNKDLLLSPQKAIGVGALALWALLVLPILRPDSDTLRSFAADVIERRPLRTDVGKYISASTHPSDTVLWWGIGAELNFEANRKTPSKYVYNLPLLREGFADSKRWNSFLQDLRDRPPVLIVSSSGQDVPPLGALPDELERACECVSSILTGLSSLSTFVRENYVHDDVFSPSIEVYRLREH